MKKSFFLSESPLKKNRADIATVVYRAGVITSRSGQRGAVHMYCTDVGVLCFAVSSDSHRKGKISHRKIREPTGLFPFLCHLKGADRARVFSVWHLLKMAKTMVDRSIDCLGMKPSG
ncbi:hypothetical protein [Pseudomonas sp. RA_105y_Pfl2_P56]|uniref:hypothetical protein n=1 Tax=Pseudomonas sp. RA_105y_Pfl2_P56 TaxID=3088701 RepID=UPI0030D88B8C